MTLSIGDKIRELRRARGITQEQLADAVGISFQAVSKWETGIALPDITLVPALAGYFGVTTDELFDFKLREQSLQIEKICSEAFRYRESEPARSREILHSGLERYPDNEVLLNNLLYVTDYSHDPDATIALAGKLIAQTRQDDIKYDALRFLAYAYSAKGDAASAKAAIEQIPELYFTKLSEAAFVLTGQAKYDAAEKQKWISFETLLQMMWKLAECYEADGNTVGAVAETERALRLIGAFGEEEKISRFENYREYFTSQLDRMKAKKC
jgi:Predicted transcriptional regulators